MGDATRDLVWVIGIFVALGLLWFFSGGPTRPGLCQEAPVIPVDAEVAVVDDHFLVIAQAIQRLTDRMDRTELVRLHLHDDAARLCPFQDVRKAGASQVVGVADEDEVLFAGEHLDHVLDHGPAVDVDERLRLGVSRAPEAVAREAKAVDGVRDCHEVRTRGTSDAIFADLRLHVDGDVPLSRAHDIGHLVEERLKRAFPGLRDVVVHLEPDNESHS